MEEGAAGRTGTEVGLRHPEVCNPIIGSFWQPSRDGPRQRKDSSLHCRLTERQPGPGITDPIRPPKYRAKQVSLAVPPRHGAGQGGWPRGPVIAPGTVWQPAATREVQPEWTARRPLCTPGRSRGGWCASCLLPSCNDNGLRPSRPGRRRRGRSAGVWWLVTGPRSGRWIANGGGTRRGEGRRTTAVPSEAGQRRQVRSRALNQTWYGSGRRRPTR